MPNNSRHTILIVDDTPLNIVVLMEMLRNEYTITVATNGERALQLAGGCSPPDLILMDIVMPGLSGYDVCATLKQNPLTAHIPLIFVSGLTKESEQQKGLDLGAVDFIQKPFSPSLVRARIRNHLELKRHHDQLEALVKERTSELEAKQLQLVALNEELEHRVQDEVRKNREKDSIMLHQDKLASIGQLAAGVAHEINNPMSFILSNLSTLRKYAVMIQQYVFAMEETLIDGCAEKQRAKIEEMCQHLDMHYILEDLPNLISECLEGGERIKQIVLDLKDFARSDEDRMIATDLNHCVQSTVNIVRNEIMHVAKLDLQLGSIPTVVCNPQQINQVIANLLVNAAHAIEGHGRITVCTVHELDHVLVTVADTGHGIPAEIINRIFDPFFTTKDIGKGTGLGLSISYGIIKAHGGDITLKSEPGEGTTFMIRLPVAAPAFFSLMTD